MHVISFNFGLEKYLGLLVYSSAVIAFLASFFRPALALYVLIPLLPFQTARYRLHPYPLGHAFIDLMLIASLAGSICRGQCVFPKPWLRAPLIAITAFTYISLWKGSVFLSLPWPIWFDQERLANWKDNVLVPLLLFVAVYSAIRSGRQMRVLLLLMCLTTAAFNRNVYNGAGQSTQTTFRYDKRAGSGEIGSNGLAAFEVQLGFLVLGLASFEKRWRVKTLYWAFAAFCLYSMMLTYSRGAYVAFAAAWLVFGLVKTRKLLIGLAIFAATWQAIVPTSVRDRILMTYSADSGLDSSAGTRVTLWEDAMEVIKGDPILGAGYDTYEFMHRSETLNDTHNFYMKVLVEGGAVGLALLLLIFGQLARLGYSAFREAADPFIAGLGLGVFLWMVCAVLTNLFGDRWNYIEISGYLWTAAAMILRGRATEQIDADHEEGIEVEQPGFAAAGV
jgi:putative inorganic carbon (hco3(-)) transporter